MELSENISSEGSRETTTGFQTIGDRGFRPLVLSRFYQVFWRDESFHVHLGTIFFVEYEWQVFCLRKAQMDPDNNRSLDSRREMLSKE